MPAAQAPGLYNGRVAVEVLSNMDTSHVVAWQIWGIKYFNAFRDPYKYAPLDVAVNNRETLRRPDGPPEHEPDDVLSYKMEKGDLLWNQLLTSHWVPAGDTASP